MTDEAGSLARISIRPGVRSGKPAIREMRITVGNVLEMMASGMSNDEILEDFPYLEADDLRACLVYNVRAVQGTLHADAA